MYSRKRILKICRMGLFAALMALGAWISIPLPIPITLQTFVLCLTSGALPLAEAMGAIFSYLVLGAVGLPVFAGFNAGIATFIGPTGGFLLGFLPTALCISLGMHSKRSVAFKISITILSTLLLYVCGSLWYTLVYGGKGVITACILPFLPADLIKVVLSVPLAMRIKRHLR